MTLKSLISIVNALKIIEIQDCLYLFILKKSVGDVKVGKPV